MMFLTLCVPPPLRTSFCHGLHCLHGLKNNTLPYNDIVMINERHTVIELKTISYNPMCLCLSLLLSYPVFIPKPSTHHMHDPGSIVPHIWPKGFTDNQMSRIKYDYYYINSVSKDHDDSQRNGTAKDYNTIGTTIGATHSL
jgi:hypothetical protein